MPKLLKYKDLAVTMLHATNDPAYIIGTAVRITMSANFTLRSASHNLCKYLLDAEHTSLFEHVTYTFLIRNVSRSFLAQITRHRISSFTSASQHYQDYRDYPCVLSNEHECYGLQNTLDNAYHAYEILCEDGMPKEDARQVLPNAAAVNILWTINARSLAGFLRQRLCRRNVAEMQHFAETILSLVKEHFPELFNFVGPQCFRGDCKQGRLRCKEGSWI